MKAFGQEGRGVFPGSSVVAKEISRQYQVRKMGNIQGITERFYAIIELTSLVHEKARRKSNVWHFIRLATPDKLFV